MSTKVSKVILVSFFKRSEGNLINTYFINKLLKRSEADDVKSFHLFLKKKLVWKRDSLKAIFRFLKKNYGLS